MSTAYYLSLIADTIETQAGATTSANTTHPGYWKRIASAAETIAGAVSSANDTLTGYAKRAAVALNAAAGFNGAGNYNANEEGYLAWIVAALESIGSPTTGSTESRFYQLINGVASFGSHILREDGFFILREDGGKFLRES